MKPVNALLWPIVPALVHMIAKSVNIERGSGACFGVEIRDRTTDSSTEESLLEAD